MKCPAELDPVAKKFWRQYHDDLVSEDTDYPNFILLCRNWSLVSQLKPEQDGKQAILYMALNKQILAQQKAFGLASKKPKEGVELDIRDVIQRGMDAAKGSETGRADESEG